MIGPVEDFRGLERRLTLAYVSAFAVVLIASVAIAHVVLAVTMRADERARVADLIREARGAYETVDGRPRIDTDGPRLLDDRAEGVAWYDASGLLAGREGRVPGRWSVTATTPAQIGNQLVAQATSVGGSVRVATGLDRDAAMLRRTDVALAAGTVVALALATFGGTLLARRAIAGARDSMRAMREFTADAAHELRGPLAAVLGNVQASLRDDAELAGAHARRLSAIDVTARSMTRTVDDLLLLARAVRPFGRDLHAVDVAASAASVVTTRAELAAEAGIALRCTAPERARAYGDPSEIERIVANLVDNALRHTDRGGTVDVTTAVVRGGVTVVVRDTGIGIAPADVSRIFDRFWHGDPVRATRAGSGLGLAIVRALARRHGGDVSVESELGRGSEFTLALPERPPRPAIATPSRH